MKFIFTSYVSTPEFSQPAPWLKRIEAYTGILESLSRNHEVTGIERINYEGKYEQNGVQYYFIKLKKKVCFFPWRMHRRIKELQPDVVFVNGLVFPLQVIQLRLTVGKAVKIVVLHRAEKPFKGLKRHLQKLADRCVNAYLFMSSEFGNEWRMNINVKKVHEVIQASSIFFPIEKPDVKRQSHTRSDLSFLWVGRLDSNKDPVTVITGFIQFLKEEPDAKLYLIYQGGELLQQVKDLINSDERGSSAIRLVGKVIHDQMQTWYTSVNFILSGSHYEGSGVAVCEAMSCGCIPIVTNILSFRRMTGPGKCGFLFEAGNEKDLLAALLKTRNMAIEMERNKVIKQFSEELSFEAIAGKVNRLVSSL